MAIIVAKLQEKVILLKKFKEGEDISLLAQLLAQKKFYIGNTQFRDVSSIKSELLRHNADSRGYVKLFRNGEFAEVRFHSGHPEIAGCLTKLLDVDQISPKELEWLLSS